MIVVPEIETEEIALLEPATEIAKALAGVFELARVSSKLRINWVGVEVFTFPEVKAGALVSGEITVKICWAIAIPFGVVTTTRPDVAPVGILTVMVVAVAVNEVVDFAPNCTFVALPREVPVITTDAPTKPDVTDKDVIFGAALLSPED